MSMRQTYSLNPATGRVEWWYRDEGPSSARPSHGTTIEGTSGTSVARPVGGTIRYAIQRRRQAEQPRREAA